MVLITCFTHKQAHGEHFASYGIIKHVMMHEHENLLFLACAG